MLKRTRHLLQQALLELMQEKSFQSISVQDIAERATVNRATFYAHFQDKYDLLDASLREGFQERLAGSLPQTVELDARGLRQLIVITLEFLAQVDRHPAPAEKPLDARFQTAVQDELYEFLLARIQKMPPSRQTPETAAMVMSWAIFGAGIQWSRGARSSSPQEMADQILDALSGVWGFAPDKPPAGGKPVALP